jgi:hypothetical protein
MVKDVSIIDVEFVSTVYKRKLFRENQFGTVLVVVTILGEAEKGNLHAPSSGCV